MSKELGRSRELVGGWRVGGWVGGWVSLLTLRGGAVWAYKDKEKTAREEKVVYHGYVSSFDGMALLVQESALRRDFDEVEGDLGTWRRGGWVGGQGE